MGKKPGAGTSWNDRFQTQCLNLLMTGDYIFVDVAEQLLQLHEQSKQARSRAFADGTFNNYYAVWVKFLKFCIFFSFTLPASGGTLMLFAQRITNKVKSHKTVQWHMTAVKKLHLLLGLTVNGFQDIFIDLPWTDCGECVLMLRNRRHR